MRNRGEMLEIDKEALFEGFLRAEIVSPNPHYGIIAKAFDVYEDSGFNWEKRLEYDRLYRKYKDTFEYRLFVLSRNSDEEGQT